MFICFLKETERRSIPLWIRHVVVPYLTDSTESILKISEISKAFATLEKIELLPFKKLCETKYNALGIDFPLRNTPPCSRDTVEALEKLL